jgi:Spy/CpxP family protein refolding chaperone
MKRILVLAAALSTTALLAADDVENSARRPGADGRVALPGNSPGSFERILTDEQRQQIRAFIQAEGAPLREHQQKASQLRRELQEAAFNGKADAKMVKQKVDEIAKLEAEQLRVRTMALVKVAGSFTPDQRQKVKEMTERLRAPSRPPLGGGQREGEALRKAEPAAPPPPEK